MKKMICFVTAIAGTAEAFLRDHIVALRKEYAVYYVSNEPEEKISVLSTMDITVWIFNEEYLYGKI